MQDTCLPANKIASPHWTAHYTGSAVCSICMPLLTTAARRSPSDLLLATEALLLLAVFRLSLTVVSVRRILRTITRGPVQPVQVASPDTATLATAIRIRWAIEAVTRNSPAEFVCFPQTLTGYAMLRRRGVPATMVYGVARGQKGELLAHTWLMIGDRTVVGGEGSEAFSPIERWC